MGLSFIYMYRHGIHVLPQGALEWFKSEFGSGAGSRLLSYLSVDLCDPRLLGCYLQPRLPRERGSHEHYDPGAL